jgi:hypothetical protein
MRVSSPRPRGNLVRAESRGPRRGRTPGPRPGRRLAAAILAAALAGPAASAAEEAGAEADPELVATVQAIREAFRSRRTIPINGLLPPGGKVYLAAKAIAPEAAFYSRDQTMALLNQAFLALETVEFHININLRKAGGGPESPQIVCPAFWIYLDRGARAEVGLRFLLARRNDHWTLSEIREGR